MENSKKSKAKLIILITLISLVVIVIGGTLVYAQVSPSIRDNVYINGVHVGSLTKEQALLTVNDSLEKRDSEAITLIIEGQSYPINDQSIELRRTVAEAVDEAWMVGRSINPIKNLFQIVTLPLTTIPITLEYTFDPALLALEIDTIAEIVDKPGKDIRLFFDGDTVEVHTDTEDGHILNRSEAFAAVVDAINNNRLTAGPLSLATVKPSIELMSAEQARDQAQRIIHKPIRLTTNDEIFTLYPERLSLWIDGIANNGRLELAINEQEIAAYVATVAEELDAEPQSPSVTVGEDGLVTDFIVPVPGKALDQEQAIASIASELQNRKNNTAHNDDEEPATEIALTISETKPEIIDQSAQELGIIELIGKASTRFTGSPPNRIANIKNGVKFLTGVLIAPDEEFSTLDSLGEIDNTNGYLPELVIKGDRTVPEFGGGLCQVSTTLFRATMNTGLPITARRNHSYRVGYYEKDADGVYIGPGLDATIYSPNPDFRFVNDTNHHILVQGSVVGDKITFEFYGTKDGRVSEIDGPHTLSTTPAGEPIYAETDTLPPGEVRQIETAHAGGSAVATYTVTYPDGTVETEEYTSFYRNWPARYLVGVDPETLNTEDEDADGEVEPSVESTEL